MAFKEDTSRIWVLYLVIRKLMNSIFSICIVVMLVAGCKSSTSSNGEDTEEKTDSSSQTYDLVLSDSEAKVGTITTREITEDDDAYIDDGFFITISVTDSSFEAPFDINMVDSDSHCGTFDVQPDEQAEMPCNYNDYLAAPAELTVVDENGDGDSAHPAP